MGESAGIEVFMPNASGCCSEPAIDRVFPGDARYRDLVRRTAYGRAPGEPDVFYVVRDAAEVVAALQHAVDSGARLAVRSGGQCHEDFVANDAIRAVIDTSLMRNIAWDPERAAFSVECGATLGELYRTLFLGWGVMLPAGVSPDVGVGGHILGGGFGFFARQHGLAVDHLEAVEVAVVGDGGRVELVVASRDPADPNRELWWAHTGGGGGNFGIVTRYWLRSPDAAPTPTNALPRAPASVIRFSARWDWSNLDARRFGRLVRNHFTWCAENSAPGCGGAQLYATLALPRLAMGPVGARGVCVGGQDLIESYVAALDAGVDAMAGLSLEPLSWLAFIQEPLPGLGHSSGKRLGKTKDAFLKQAFDERLIFTAYRYLTRPTKAPIAGVLGLGTYGGAVNAVDPAATASAQRGSVITMYCNAGWMDPAHEAEGLEWVRTFYGDLFHETGGVPVPGDLADGAFINHPDSDLADPRWNRSGVAWHDIYYKQNYPRLQAIKARWDPNDVFRHALSIRPSSKT